MGRRRPPRRRTGEKRGARARRRDSKQACMPRSRGTCVARPRARSICPATPLEASHAAPRPRHSAGRPPKPCLPSSSARKPPRREASPPSSHRPARRDDGSYFSDGARQRRGSCSLPPSLAHTHTHGKCFSSFESSWLAFAGDVFFTFASLSRLLRRRSSSSSGPSSRFLRYLLRAREKSRPIEKGVPLGADISTPVPYPLTCLPCSLPPPRAIEVATLGPPPAAPPASLGGLEAGWLSFPHVLLSEQTSGKFRRPAKDERGKLGRGKAASAEALVRAGGKKKRKKKGKQASKPIQEIVSPYFSSRAHSSNP